MIKQCPKCSYSGEIDESLNKTISNTIQIRGNCVKCGRWLLWVPYAESSIVKSILLREANKDA